MQNESTDAPSSSAASPKDGTTPRAMELTNAEYERLKKICRAVANKKMHLFARLPAITIEDVTQAALTGSATSKTLGGALRAHANYSPPHSYNSWIGQAAGTAILDLCKSAGRERQRVEKLGASMEHDYGTFEYSESSPDAGVPEMLPDFPRKLASYYAGRIGHSPDAYVAALLYREHHGIGWRTLHRRLRSDKALLSMLGLKCTPAISSLRNAANRLKSWGRRNPPASRE